MGLSIHYSGTVKSKNLIPLLVEEISEVCEIMRWKASNLKDQEVNGIVFSPKDCEPLFFTFNKHCQLVSPIYLQYEIEPATTISVKTQFAGIDAHIAIIKFLHYLDKKYFSQFIMMDEGNYWQTGDEEILRNQFKLYNILLDSVTKVLQDISYVENETPESLADRIEKILRKKFGKK